MTDIQILEKLFSMISEAGDGAFTLAVLWILKDYFEYVLTAGLFVFFVLMMVKTIKIFVSRFGFIEEISKASGISLPFYDHEKKAILKVLENNKETIRHLM